MTNTAVLQRIMPQCSDAEDWAAHLTEAMNKYEINSKERIAAFLAQIAHESGELRYVKEIWGPTEAQKRYEGRKDLGNIHPGDGEKYKGRGLIQVTGRNNYQKCGRALELPLESKPELLESPEHASMSAAWFFGTHGCNEMADDGNFEAITRKINGGLNGWSHRVKYWSRAKEALKTE